MRTVGIAFPITLVAILALAVVAACDDPTGPPFSEPAALVRLRGNPDAARTHRFLAIGVESRRALGWSDRVMYRIIGTALSPDRQTLYVSGTGKWGLKEDQILALDTRTLDVRWREFLADSAGYRVDRFDGVEVQTSHEVEVSPDGRRIYIASASRDGLRGVAVLDAATRDLVGFLGAYENGSMELAVVPPGPFSGAGAVAVSAGAPGGWPNVTGTVSFFHPGTSELLDSLDVSAALAGEGDGVMNMAVAPDGRHLYLRSNSGWLLKYDLVDRRIAASAWRGSPACLWCLTVSPDGQRVYLAETWSHVAPSSGVIAVYDADLNALPPIDLSGVRVPRHDGSTTDPPALNSVTVAPDGTLLVATGAWLAQLWGFQSARVFFVDPSSGEVLHVVREGGDFAALQVFIP